MSYEQLRVSAMEWDAYQRTRIRITNLGKAMQRLGVGMPIGLTLFIDGTDDHPGLREHEANCIKAIRASCEDDPAYLAIREWVDETTGIGPAVLCVLGLVRPIGEFANPAKLWKYLGLHVNSEGRADRHPAPNDGIRFSPRLRAYATVRIVDPIIKCRQSPYRVLYDDRRAHTAVTHPEWATENPKAPDMHSHRDAIRYVAKRVWRDVWKVAHKQAMDDLISSLPVPAHAH